MVSVEILLHQDEELVLAQCQSTQHLRDARGNRVIFPEILHSNECADFKLIYDVVNTMNFQWKKKGSEKWRCEHAQSRGFLGNFVNLHNATS